MSSPQKSAPRLNDLAVVPSSGHRKPAARDVEPVFDGTIASACESIGISVEQMIEMMRWAKESDSRVAQFLHAWDALDPSEQQDSGTADAVRQRLGLALIELLRIVADVTCRIAMYSSQIIAALSHPLVVGKTVELALNAEDDSNKLAAQTILHKAAGFLPTPKGSQTTIAITQNAQANATSRSIVAAPSPEHTIRSLTDRFNEVRGLLRSPAARSTEALHVEVPEGVEDGGK
jgi:predicted TIM-barrel enzyme